MTAVGVLAALALTSGCAAERELPVPTATPEYVPVFEEPEPYALAPLTGEQVAPGALDHPSIAAKIGCTAETLRRWCRDEAGRRAGPAAQAADDQARLRLLEREVKELRRANEILRKASAYFAMAELDRRER